MIARKTWGDLWLLGLIYYVVLQALIIPPILLWDDLYDELRKAGLFTSVIGSFMPKLLEALKSATEAAAFKLFMGVMIFFRAVNICGIAAAVLLGTGIIARERENQTLEFLVARPVSRSRILWSKYWVCCIVLVVPIFVSSWSTIYFAPMVEHELSFSALTLGAMHSSVFVLAIFTLTCVCSVVFRTQLNSAATIGTFVVIQAAIFFVQTIRVASIFQLSDFDTYGPIMSGTATLGSVFWGWTIWPLIACVVFYALADRLFRRTEL